MNLSESAYILLDLMPQAAFLLNISTREAIVSAVEQELEGKGQRMAWAFTPMCYTKPSP